MHRRRLHSQDAWPPKMKKKQGPPAGLAKGPSHEKRADQSMKVRHINELAVVLSSIGLSRPAEREGAFRRATVHLTNCNLPGVEFCFFIQIIVFS